MVMILITTEAIETIVGIIFLYIGENVYQVLVVFKLFIVTD